MTSAHSQTRPAAREPDADPGRGNDARGNVSLGLSRLQRLLASRRVADRMVEAAGIELSQQAAGVLRAVRDGEARPVAEVARAAQMDVGAVSRQLNTLEDRKLVTRTPSPHHGSVVLVRPTKRGLELAARDEYVRSQHLRNVLAGWSPDEAEQFGKLLVRFVDDLQRTTLPTPPTKPPNSVQ